MTASRMGSVLPLWGRPTHPNARSAITLHSLARIATKPPHPAFSHLRTHANQNPWTKPKPSATCSRNSTALTHSRTTPRPRFPFPSPRQRREAIRLHDLSHLLTGYDTSWTGEGEIATWELASGFPRRYWIGYVYPPMTFAIGLLIAPWRTMTAFRKGLGRKNVYRLLLESAALDAMKVGDLNKALEP